MPRTSRVSAAIALSLLAIAGAGTTAHAADGAQVFHRYCFVCHDTEPGKNKLGPSLAGILGRKSGSLEGYAYSAAMRSAGVTWNEKTLDRYLDNPRKLVPNTKMMFVGVKNPDERQAVIQYLVTLKAGS